MVTLLSQDGGEEDEGEEGEPGGRKVVEGEEGASSHRTLRWVGPMAEAVSRVPSEAGAGSLICFVIFCFWVGRAQLRQGNFS